MDNNMQLVRKSSINYGVALGVILALLTTLMYVTDVELFTKWWIGILTIIVVIATGIVSTAKSKSLLGGFMSFKEAFSAYFITVAVGLLISTLVGILIFNVLDPDLAVYLQERTIEITREFMERFGAPEADINAAIADMEGTNNFSVLNQLKSYVFGLVFQAIIGLLVALIFKKKDPNAVD